MSVAVCRRSLLPVPAVEDYCQCCLQVLAGLLSVALTKKLRQLILSPLFSFSLSFLFGFSTAKVSLSGQKGIGQIDTIMG